MDLSEAWDEIVKDAEEAAPAYVSLYSVEQCYGGPEEGGWYYDHWSLEQSKACPTEAAAKLLGDKVRAFAKERTEQAAKEWADTCAAQCRALEDRGLHDEPDYGGNGPDTPNRTDFRVVIEKVSGQRSTTERPYYE